METNWVVTAINSVGSDPMRQGFALGLVMIFAGLMICVPIITIRNASGSGR